VGIKVVPRPVKGKKDKRQAPPPTKPKKGKTAGYAQGGNVQAKQQRYAHGGKVSAGRPGLKPTNQSTVKARGMGAATRGGNFKV
jgi:hypothetical protein